MSPGGRATTLGACATRVVERVAPPRNPPAPFVGLEDVGVGTLALLEQGTTAAVAGPVLRFAADDVLYGSLRPYFRKVVRAEGPGTCTPEAWVLRARKGVDPAYLFWLVADPRFSEACTRAADGTRMPRARWEVAADWPVCLPPPDEQRRIAEALGTLHRRAFLARSLAETMQQILDATWRARARAVPGRPGTLGDVAREVRAPIRPGAVPSDTPCVGLADMPRGRLLLETWGRLGDAASLKSVFEAGDFLFGKLRPNLRKLVVAPVAGACSPDVVVVRPRAPAWSAWVLGVLSSRRFQDHLAAAADGTRMPRTSWQAMAAWPVALPSGRRAAELQAEMGPLVDRIRAASMEIRALGEVRDAMLGRLLTR